MSKTKLALLGVGDVAQRDYLPEFHRLADRAEIVAACGRTASRVQAMVAGCGLSTRGLLVGPVICNEVERGTKH